MRLFVGRGRPKAQEYAVTRTVCVHAGIKFSLLWSGRDVLYTIRVNSVPEFCDVVSIGFHHKYRKIEATYLLEEPRDDTAG